MRVIGLFMVNFKTMPWRDIVKSYVLGVGYLFMLTIAGALAVTVYNYFYPIDVASESSILTVALLFIALVVLDFGLMFSGKLTPTLVLIVLVIAPILMLYKLIKSSDLVNIDQNTPRKLKNYIPPRFIS